MEFYESFLGKALKEKEGKNVEEIILDHVEFNRYKLPISEKLKLIRLTYGLLAKRTCIIMGVNYRNYQNYENGKVIPSAQGLTLLSEYTGVSVAWMLGTSDEIYDESAILAIENIYLCTNTVTQKHLFAIINALGAVPIYPVSNGYLDEKYYDLEQRRKNYTLKQRANIIFCLHEYIAHCLADGCFLAASEDRIYFDWVKAIEKKNPFLNMLNKMVYIEGNTKEFNEQIANFEPVYDLEAELNKLPIVIPKEELLKGNY